MSPNRGAARTIRTVPSQEAVCPCQAPPSRSPPQSRKSPWGRSPSRYRDRQAGPSRGCESYKERFATAKMSQAAKIGVIEAWVLFVGLAFVAVGPGADVGLGGFAPREVAPQGRCKTLFAVLRRAAAAAQRGIRRIAPIRPVSALAIGRAHDSDGRADAPFGAARRYWAGHAACDPNSRAACNGQYG